MNGPELRWCPSLEHDGGLAPIERVITVVDRDPWQLCAYCAEGRVAQVLREGLTVTVEPVWRDACWEWNDGHDCTLVDGHLGDHVCVCGDRWNGSNAEDWITDDRPEGRCWKMES